jgi:hypothetical protein
MRPIGALVDEWLTDHVAVAVAVHDDVTTTSTIHL